MYPWQLCLQSAASQRSLHNAPICHLLLKVVVKGTHQCDFLCICISLPAANENEDCVVLASKSHELHNTFDLVQAALVCDRTDKQISPCGRFNDFKYDA